MKTVSSRKMVVSYTLDQDDLRKLVAHMGLLPVKFRDDYEVSVAVTSDGELVITLTEEGGISPPKTQPAGEALPGIEGEVQP